MLLYIIRRLALSVVIVFLAVLALFLMLHSIP